MIKALIIENEPPVSDYLVTLLQRNFADVEVVAVCDTIASSLEAIRLYQPDLVFLDVELNPPETGFDILRKLASIDFKVIFTTAYNQYAIPAIKFSALDYLLKPIDEEQLQQAVKKYLHEKSATSILQRDSLLSYNHGYDHAKIGLPTVGGYSLVFVRDILYCQGESSQASLFMKDKKHIVVNRTLKECEEMLEKFGFCRIHKSFLVNLQYIKQYHKGDGGFVLLEDDSHLDVSKTYKDDLMSQLKKAVSTHIQFYELIQSAYFSHFTVSNHGLAHSCYRSTCFGSSFEPSLIKTYTMESQNPMMHPQQPQYIIIKSNKSVGIALILTFFFGPLGMLYSTISGGIIMLIITGIVALFTLGFGLLITWPICMIWAAISANNYNNKLRV